MGEVHKFPVQKTRAERKSIVRHEEKIRPEREAEKREVRTKIRRQRRNNRQFTKKSEGWTSKR